MRTRSRIKPGQKPSNLPGRSGGSSGGTTCTRQVTLDEVIEKFWGGNFPTDSSVDSTTIEEFTDTLTPGFFAKQRSGAILPTNPMSSKTVETVDTQAQSLLGYTIYKYNQCSGADKSRQSINYRHGTVTVTAGPIGAPTKLLTNSEINQVSLEALASLRTQGMDVLTSAAEFHKTLAMVAGARRKLITVIENLLDSLRKLGKKPKTWGAFIQALSDPWLEGRFGWRILWYDLLNIMDYIDNLDKRSRIVVGRSSTSTSRDYTSTYGDSTVTHKVSIGYPGMLDPKIPGYGNVLNTAWELIPFSLVVDMFFDVQSRVIALCNTPQNVTELMQSAFMVEELTRTQSLQAHYEPPAGYALVQHNNPVLIEQRYEVKTRTLISQPKLDLPPLRINLGGYKPIDLAFLARILVKKVFS